MPQPCRVSSWFLEGHKRGGKGGGQPNATDLISLLTAKAANDLGVAVTAGQQAAPSPAVSQ